MDRRKNVKPAGFKIGAQVRSYGVLGAWARNTPPTSNKFDRQMPEGSEGVIEAALPDGWYILRFSDGSYAPIEPGMVEVLPVPVR